MADKKGDILKMLRAIAQSDTVDAFEKNLSTLKQNDIWLSHQKLRNWINGTWLKEAKVQLLTQYTHLAMPLTLVFT